MSDNVIDLNSKKSEKKSGGSGGDGGGSTEGKGVYYAVTPVVPVEEGDRLIKMKYMTESGYLDLLGVLNQMQMHNKKRNKLAISIATISSISSIVMSIIVIYLIGMGLS